MNSLRVRLILGLALIAVMPLAVAMALFSQRIQKTVRAQSAERLTATLGILQAQLREDGERVAAKLDLLARDPGLKRLYLVEAASDAELREFLGTQQYLLGLDYLWIADSSGRVVAEGSAPAALRARLDREPVAVGALAPANAAGLNVARVAGGRALALDGGAEIRYRGERVGIVRGGMALDSTRLARLARGTGVELSLREVGGGAVVSTVPALPAISGGRGGEAVRVTVAGRSFLARGAPLEIGAEPRAVIVAFVSTAATDETLAALRLTALLLALFAVAVAVALGMLWSHLVSRPVERLAAFSERIARGEWEQPLAVESVREIQTLVAALERMRGELRGQRERLAAGERQAAYGQMARKVAHEIKNPLTPIAISIADLRRSYEQGRPDFGAILDAAVRTIGEEVATLKRLIHEFSEFGRFPAAKLERVAVTALFDDLRTLYGREVAEGRLRFAEIEPGLVMHADPAQLRQALTNLILNGLDAIPAGGRVEVRARRRIGAIELTVGDDGPGLSAEQKSQLFVPGFTTKAHGTGLGLTIVERIVSDHGGTIAVESAPGRGTTFHVNIPTPPGA